MFIHIDTHSTRRQRIEQLIELVLAQGIICPNKSPYPLWYYFSKGKDNTRRFCVDYGSLDVVFLNPLS